MNLKKYGATFKIHFLETLQYKWDVVLSGLGTVVYILAFIYLWSAIYKQYQVPEFTLTAMIWYFVATQSIRFVSKRPIHEISEEIQKGTITNFITRPIKYIWYKFSAMTGESIFRAGASFIFGGILATIYFGFPSVHIINIPLIIVAIFFGILINYLIGFCIASLSFLIEDATPFGWVYEKIVFVFGGFLFPIDIFNGFWLAFAKALPTSYFLYYPAKLFVNFNMKLFISTIIGQLAWIVGLLILSSVIMHFAIKKVSINGG